MLNPLKVSLENIIPLTEARDHFSQIVNEVQKDKLYVLTKGGKPAVAIVDVKYLEQITNGNANRDNVVSEIKKDPTKVGLPPMVKHDTNPTSNSFNPPITPKPSTPPPPPPPPLPRPNPTPYQPQPPKPVTPPAPRPPMPSYQPSKPTPPPYQPPRPPMTPAPKPYTPPTQTPPPTTSPSYKPAASTPSYPSSTLPNTVPPSSYSQTPPPPRPATPPPYSPSAPVPAPKPNPAPQATFEATSMPNLYPSQSNNSSQPTTTVDVKPMADPEDQVAIEKQASKDDSRMSPDDKPGPAQYSNSITSAGDEEPEDMGID